MILPIKTLLFFVLLSSATPGWSIECAKATSIVETTLCGSPQLIWLDLVLNNTYRNVMKLEEPKGINQQMQLWQRSRDACTNDNCLLWAYLQGIGQLYHLHGIETFNWDGEWWNSTAVHGDGGKIIISNTNQWAFNFDAQIWGGVYKSTLRGGVKMFYGVGMADNIEWGSKCTVLFIPRPDGNINVTSDSDGSCKLLMRGGVTVDGIYVRSKSDPRPSATLLSLGIFPSVRLNERFRQLAGKDYQSYVDDANNVVYTEDLDAQNATVLTLSQKGTADRRAAIVMFTPSGKIWAMRLLPEMDDKNLPKIQFITTETNKTLPKTLANWQALFQN